MLRLVGGEGRKNLAQREGFVDQKGGADYYKLAVL